MVPEALASELFDKLTEYYSDDPNVTVIVDRRKASRRKPGEGQPRAGGSASGVDLPFSDTRAFSDTRGPAMRSRYGTFAAWAAAT